MPEIYEMCETLGIDYVIGQITNESYTDRIEGALRRAQREFAATGETARVFSSFSYRARSWMRRRRIVAKLEVMAQGQNPRFVVANLPGTPEDVYATYTARGQAENFIKDLKNAMFADRLSWSAFHANQFRLLMHAAAYILMFVLRRTMVGTELERAQMNTLRIKLLKIGATIKVTAQRVWVHLSEHQPSLSRFLLRARQVIGAFEAGDRSGAYWGIRSDIAEYKLADCLDCPHKQTMELANTSTRLGALAEDRQEKLINWGYAVTDAALRKYYDSNIAAAREFPYESVKV